MKRSLFTKHLKQSLLAIPAAALMLGQAQAGTSIGINFQANYGYGTYSPAVSTSAFGIPASGWTMASYTAPSGTMTVGGSVGVSWSSSYSYYTFAFPGVSPGGTMDDYLGYPQDANVFCGTLLNPAVSLTSMTSLFPNGYVVQAMGAYNYSGTLDDVTISDGTTTDTLHYISKGTFNYGWGWSGTYGIYPATDPMTGDSLTVTDPGYLSGFVITDQPVVTVPPVGGNVAGGTPLVLNAGVAALPNALAYQWRLNGTPIANATNATFLKPAAAAGDAGNYDLVVTNQFGSVTSIVASVTVAINTWSTAATAAGDTDVATNGTLVFAYDWSSTAATVNDVNFTAPDTGATIAGFGGGNYSGSLLSGLKSQ